MPENTTPFRDKAAILADLWMSFRGDEEWSDFFEYNDLGLPLAYAVSNNIAGKTDMLEKMVGETFDLLLQAVGEEDIGFDNLDDLLGDF